MGKKSESGLQRTPRRTFRMDALKAALLAVLAFALFIDCTFGAVLHQQHSSSADDADHSGGALGQSRDKRSARKNAPKKPVSKQQQPPPMAQDFKADCMTPSLECFVECCMKDAKWVGDDGRVNAMAIETHVVGNLKRRTYNAPWVPIATEAIKSCVQESENLPMPTIQNAKGKQCNTQPAIYMNCVRKKLILNCPATKFSDSYGCKKARMQLEKCAPVDVLKAISQGGPLPDMNMGNNPMDHNNNMGGGMGGSGMGGGMDPNNMGGGGMDPNNNMGGGMDGNNIGGGMDGGMQPQPDMPPQGGEQPPEMPQEQPPPPDMPQEQPPPEEAPPPPEPAAEPPAEPAAEGEAPPEEPQPAAEEAPPPEEPQPAAEEMAPPPEEPPAEEPPAEEPPPEE